MFNNENLQLFEDQPIRTAWNELEEEWYFSIVDVIGALSESKDSASYWRKLKQRLKEEGNETVTNCHALQTRSEWSRSARCYDIQINLFFRSICTISELRS